MATPSGPRVSRRICSTAGGGLVRQTAGGVTVSVIGTLLTGITVDPTPTLSAARVAAILGEVSGASLVATSAPPPL